MVPTDKPEIREVVLEFKPLVPHVIATKRFM
jgi:hypothetical protein